MIVSIDPKNPGELVLAREAYDHRVAGIISGAGGVKTGMLMIQGGTKADGKHPVALTGSVYCQVDASFGAITPGDMITTSCGTRPRPAPSCIMRIAGVDAEVSEVLISLNPTPVAEKLR